MEQQKAIIIAGPTTTGKSEISELVARKINGAIINSDNYYFYANDLFHIGLGLSKDEPPSDMPSYLFGGRELSHPKPDPDEFFDHVRVALQDAQSKGMTPIIQGCSFTLNSKLIQSGIASHVFIPIWATKENLVARCRMRVRQMIDEGLLDEAQAIIASDLDSSWIATEGIIYRPTIEYLKDGGGTIGELIDAITQGIIAKAEEQEVKYRTLEEVTWVTHANDVQAAARQISKGVMYA